MSDQHMSLSSIILLKRGIQIIFVWCRKTYLRISISLPLQLNPSPWYPLLHEQFRTPPWYVQFIGDIVGPVVDEKAKKTTTTGLVIIEFLF